MNPACKLHAIDDNEWNKLEFDENERTDIERRIMETERIIESQRVGTNFAQTTDREYIAMINQDNARRVGEMAGTLSLRETNVSAMRSFLVRELGVVSDFVSGDYNAAGWVRESINRVERLSKGGVDKALRDLGVQDFVNTNYRRLTQELKKRGIRDADRAYILSEAARQGFFPFINGTEMLRPAGRAYLASESDRFVRELRDRFKLDADLIQDIVRTGNNTGHLYNRMMFLMQDAGVKVDAWDVMPRLITDEAAQRVNWKYGTDKLIIYQNGDKSDAVDVFLRSTASNAYVVEDEVLLDMIIRRIGVQEFSDPRALYKRALPDLENPGIADVIDSRRSLIPVMADMLERGYGDTVAALYDSRLLSKIPLSNADVFQNMQRLMKTPFRELDEVFVTDWGEGLRLLRKNMEFMAQESGFVNLMVKNATEGNWGVSALERSTDPRFANFVPIRAAIDPRVLGRTMQANNPVLDSLYVHPFVASMARAHQEIQMSPFAMNIFARAIYTLNRTWSKLALMTLEYMPRQVLQGMMSVGISGSNLLNYPAYVYKVAAAQIAEGAGRKAPGVFDDTAKIYRLRNGRVLTERELYDYLTDIGLASKVDIQVGDALGLQGRYKNLLNPERQARYIADVLMQRGAIEGAAVTMDTVRRYVDALGVPGMVMNNVVNNATLMTIVTSSTRAAKRNPISYTLSNIVNPNRFDFVDDAVEYAKQFVYYYDDTTRANQFLQRYVLPFWGFTSRNVPAMLRYTVNHPSRFIALQRLYGLSQEPIANEPWLTEGTVPGWMIGARTIYWRVPGGRSDGRDAFFAVDLNTVDPVGSALEEVDSWLGVFGFYGDKPRATSDRLRTISGDDNPLDNFLDDKAFGMYDMVYQFARERDNPEWQQRMDDRVEVGGIQMSRGTKLLLDTLAPAFLKAPRFYQEVQARMEGADNSEPIVPKLLGIRVYALDVYENLGLTYDQLDYTMRDIKAAINRTTDMDERMRLQHIYNELEIDRIKLAEFARREGLDIESAYETLREKGIRAGELTQDGQLP